MQLTKKQAAVIYAFLLNVRLGYRNEYEKEVSDLMVKFEEADIDGFLADTELPTFSVELSEKDGMMFNIAG